MSEEWVRALRILREEKLILSGGHYRSPLGNHSVAYIDEGNLCTDNKRTEQICSAIGRAFAGSSVDAVIGPAGSGVLIASFVAKYLQGATGRNILAVGAVKRSDGTFAVETGFGNLLRTMNVLIVDTVLTTEETMRAVLEAVEDSGGNPVGVGVIVKGGGITRESIEEVPKLFAVFTNRTSSHKVQSCPQCLAGVPMSPIPGKK